MYRPTVFALALLVTLFFPSFANAKQPGAAKLPKEPAVVLDPKDTQANLVPGWFADTANGQYEIGIDTEVAHSGLSSAQIASLQPPPQPGTFGNLSQWFDADEYRGKHLKMSGWIKTDLDGGTGHLWVRVDGEGHGVAKRDCFDNMSDRPIKGKTDWTQYDLVVDVPQSSSKIVFGCFLLGTGKLWFDDVSIQPVGTDIALTGSFTTASEHRTQPINLGFEQTKK